MATDNKYDRQLRLWGGHGQKKLASSTILLFGADALGTESIKNLILPGVGRVIIVDDQIVTESDLGNNFFLEHSSLGASRAESQNLQIDKLSNEHKIPYICANTYGFYALCSVWSPELAIVQSKPADVELSDLRLNTFQTFPALNSFVDSFNQNDPQLSDAAHAHIPYPVILIKAMMEWKSTHNNQAPKNFQEKEAFKQNLKALSRDFSRQDNFAQAVKYSYIIHKKNQLPEGIQQAFNWPQESKDMNRNKKFWALIQALKVFYKQQGELPISGKVADMTADTTSFLALQKIYLQRMNKDCNSMQKIVKEKIGALDITLEEVEKFCQNLMQIKIHQFSSLNKILSSPNKETIQEESMDNESLIGLYFMLHGLQIYQNDNALPGNLDSKKELAQQLKRLQGIIKSQIEKEGAPLFVYSNDLLSQLQEYLFQFLQLLKSSGRSSNAILHNICSIIGGLVSQEVVKILVEQYTPFNNTIVFDGINSKAQVFSL